MLRVWGLGPRVWGLGFRVVELRRKAFGFRAEFPGLGKALEWTKSNIRMRFGVNVEVDKP